MSQRPECSEEQCVYAASGGKEQHVYVASGGEWGVKSSEYASNKCGVLISKRSSLSYNEQGWCGSQIPSCTTSKDLEKQWPIAVWEIHVCWSFKFFGGVSSPIVIDLIAHLYVFTSTTSTTSTHSPPQVKK